MAEVSYFWGGTAVGDAIGNAPYTDDDWSDILCYLHTRDRTVQGVIGTNRTGYSGSLAVTAVDDDVSVATGVALVDGKLYLNNAAKSLTNPRGPGADGTYYVVLRKNFATQTVTALAVTSVVQTEDVIWDLPLATAVVSGGTIGGSGLTDTRRFINQLDQLLRQGNSATVWGAVGTTNYRVSNFKIQCGAAQWTGGSANNGTVTITFPEAFSDAPLVFPRGSASLGQYIFAGIATINDDDFTCQWHDLDDNNHTTVYIYWMAIGPS